MTSTVLCLLKRFQGNKDITIISSESFKAYYHTKVIN
jgi:hypothetical protein